MASIFISYKKEDAGLAERVATALRAEGFSVWWDEGLTPRTAWDAILEREIAAAATVLVLWTPRSIVSEFVRAEAHYGQDRGKLVPVMMEPCTIPLAFMLRQTVRLCDWQGDRGDREWRKLLTWIADLASTKLGNANVPEALGAAQPNPFRDAVSYLPSGDPVVDGAFVNASTPFATAFRDREDLPVMRILPKGSFILGSPASDADALAVERPQKRVEMPAPFAMGVLPVLVCDYQAVMGTLPVPPPPSPATAPRSFFRRPSAPVSVPISFDPSAPVTYVSFDDAQAFVSRLSALTGEAYRIPSETEWEYACRANARTRYAFGDVIDGTQAVFDAAGPMPLGARPPNAFGLYNMHGNVREWTADLWHESYDATPPDGTAASDGHGSMRVVRGGSFSDGASMLRSAARMRATYSSRSAVIGFRVARALG